MVSRREKPSLLANFKFSVDQYLRETTVHGFRYLVEGRNVCEIIVWSIVISFCFVLTFFGIYSSVRGSYDNPILTSVQTTEIQKVIWKESTLSVLSNKLFFSPMKMPYNFIYISPLGTFSSSHSTCCRRIKPMGICH